MNYLWELWEIWERSPRAPCPVHGLQPARPASLRPYPQQQPEAAGSSPAAGSSRKQPRSSSPAALPRGFVGFRDIRHKNVRICSGTERRKRTPFAYRGIPVYANMSLRCLLSKFFIFIFLFWSVESNP